MKDRETSDSNVKKVSFDLDTKLCEEMDKQIKTAGYKRTGWLKIAIMEKLARDKENNNN